MKLYVIGSSSKGNGYAIECDNEILLIEAGCPLKAVRQQVDLSKVVGVLISHKHGDHAKYKDEYLQRFQVAAPREVGGIPIFEGKTQSFGGFRYTPFVVPHENNDNTPCPNAGYLIHHDKMGNLLFVTDTYVIPYRISGVNHFMIEANYSDELLNKAVESGLTPRNQADRIRLSHFSLENAIRCIEQSGLDDAVSATFIHLSMRHSNKNKFKEEAMRRLGITINIAEKGKEFFLCDMT